MAVGKVTYANIMDLSDDYRDGFVDSLRVDTEDATRMAATRADRSSGNYTVFEKRRLYRVAPCRDDPKKPPLWQVKGARIIHDQTTRCCISRTPSSSSSRSDGLLAVFLDARSDREAQDRFPDAGLQQITRPTAMAWKPRSTGRSRPT